MKLNTKTSQWFQKYFRFVNYLGTAMIYLKDNFLLEAPLRKEHVKDRILGHWGTVPGINFIYMHLNRLIVETKASFLLVTGPGHGAPANLANLFLEGTLQEFYPAYTLNEKGIGHLLRNFSWPGGFPSHLYPGIPGSILEGGELGYSLSTAYGAALDNPNLIVACIVGDGEAESGPLAASWQSNKFLNLKRDGAVLPILHANEYKISNPTVYGRMDNRALHQLFTGFDYDVRIVEGKNLHEKMADALNWAHKKIRQLQKDTRNKPYNLQSTTYKLTYKLPLIILRTLKGWTGPKEAHGKVIEGSYRSHGIPLADAKTNKASLKILEEWLKSYRIHELVGKRGRPKKEIFDFVPKGNLRMGMNKHAFGGSIRKDLKLPSPTQYEVQKEIRGRGDLSNTEIAAKYMRDIFKLNEKEKNFRIMCPDEMESNKLGAVFEATNRVFLLPTKSHDEHISGSGRVMEILSEHTLQGWLQGYLLTGRHGLFATYEAFAMINASMVDQYAKFLKQSMRIEWRKPVPSLNYLLTSLGWRQEHNGYSHQNPSFISNVLEKHGQFCSVYFPADANSFLAILEDCLKRKNSINVIAAGKQPMPQWLTLEEAHKQVFVGVGRWDWINPDHAKDPDVVLAAAGDHMTLEAMAAIDILRKLAPELKIRFVNVSELTSLGIGDERHPFRLGSAQFEHYFTNDRPIVFNFHGYPDAIKKLVWNHPAAQRFSIHGYIEEGTTTTPFDMQVLNKTSRYHLAIDLIEKGSLRNKKVREEKKKLIRYLEHKLGKHEKFIVKNGRDMPEIETWHWGSGLG